MGARVGRREGCPTTASYSILPSWSPMLTGPGHRTLPLAAVTPLLIMVTIANVLGHLQCSLCLDHAVLLWIALCFNKMWPRAPRTHRAM